MFVVIFVQRLEDVLTLKQAQYTMLANYWNGGKKIVLNVSQIFLQLKTVVYGHCLATLPTQLMKH